MRSNINRDTYWAKTCLSLKFFDGFFLPKSVLNMVVGERVTALVGRGDRRWVILGDIVTRTGKKGEI